MVHFDAIDIRHSDLELPYFISKPHPTKPNHSQLDRMLTIGEFRDNLTEFLSSIDSGVDDATVNDLVESVYYDRVYGLDSPLGDSLNMMVAPANGYCGGSDIVIMDQTPDGLYRMVLRLNFYQSMDWVGRLACIISQALHNFR